MNMDGAKMLDRRFLTQIICKHFSIGVELRAASLEHC